VKQEEDGAKATNFELEIEDRGHLAEECSAKGQRGSGKEKNGCDGL